MNNHTTASFTNDSSFTLDYLAAVFSLLCVTAIILTIILLLFFQPKHMRLFSDENTSSETDLPSECDEFHSEYV